MADINSPAKRAADRHYAEQKKKRDEIVRRLKRACGVNTWTNEETYKESRIFFVQLARMVRKGRVP